MKPVLEVQQARPAMAPKQHPNEEYYQECMQKTDEAFQEMIYWKKTRTEYIAGIKFTPIDLQKALSETREVADGGGSIGFSNRRNKDCIHMWTSKNNAWGLQVPIFTKNKWDGYSWQARADEKAVFDIVRRFFDEIEWFDHIEWKMSRHEDYVCRR